MYKIMVTKEIPNCIPKLEIGTIMIVGKELSNGMVRATPCEDVNRPSFGRRDYVLYNDEYKEVE